MSTPRQVFQSHHIERSQSLGTISCDDIANFQVAYRSVENPRVVRVCFEHERWLERSMISTRIDEQTTIWTATVHSRLNQPLQFKFVVDGKWVTTPDYSTVINNGNVNNIGTPARICYDAPNDMPLSSTETVHLCTSADGWQKHHMMLRCDKGAQRVCDVLFPSRGQYEFKFIRGGVWHTCSRYPCSGVYKNNVLDVF
eukprot:c14645_g1_i1.p1 GENE.c14645_g1_i1~~c14645_g1_i1.p1  ORF type:complete len:198 (+),score=30.52 c14645_g1_i1:401-994(+)